jgi:glutaredoxin-related protein
MRLCFHKRNLKQTITLVKHIKSTSDTICVSSVVLFMKKGKERKKKGLSPNNIQILQQFSGVEKAKS